MYYAPYQAFPMGLQCAASRDCVACRSLRACCSAASEDDTRHRMRHSETASPSVTWQCRLAFNNRGGVWAAQCLDA